MGRKSGSGDDVPSAQPPPPAGPGMGGSGAGGKSGDNGDDDKPKKYDKHHHHALEEVIYAELVEVRRTLGTLVEAAEARRLEKRLSHVPVRTSDLMRGFQAAVARANAATRAGEAEGEDIGRMSIKNLEVSVTAPVIDGGHAEDPTLMLPNIKSVDADSARISLKFTVVSMPTKAGS